MTAAQVFHMRAADIRAALATCTTEARVHDGLIPAKHVPLFEEAALPLMRELVRG